MASGTTMAGCLISENHCPSLIYDESELGQLFFAMSERRKELPQFLHDVSTDLNLFHRPAFRKKEQAVFPTILL